MAASIRVFTSSIVIGCHLTFLIVDGRFPCRPDADAGYDFSGVSESFHNRGLLYSLKSFSAVFFIGGRLSALETKVGLPGGL